MNPRSCILDSDLTEPLRCGTRRFAEVGGLVTAIPNRSAGWWKEHADAGSTHGVSAAGAASILLAGLLPAVIIAFVLHPPVASGLSPLKSIFASLTWIAVTALAGTVGMAVGRLAVRSGRVSLPALAAASGWILIPPLLLLWWRGSAWALLYFGCAAAALGLALRVLYPATNDSRPGDEFLHNLLFAELPPPDSKPLQSFLISAFAQGAIVCLARRMLLIASLLTALAGFVLAWKVASSPVHRQRPAARAGLATLMALFILIPLLLRASRMGAADGSQQTRKVKAAPADENLAWQGIILFTVPQKKVDLPPIPHESTLRPGTARPLVIPFDGSYWYFQAPRHGPGLHAHLAHGDPVALSIYSTGWIPLAMQAHQSLPQPIDLGCCRRLAVSIRNGDNRAGRIDLDVLLTDSTRPGKPTIDLGLRPIVSSEFGHFSDQKSSPVEEDVIFTIPSHPQIQRFDEITVLFFPVAERSTLGARVGIRQLELLPH